MAKKTHDMTRRSMRAGHRYSPDVRGRLGVSPCAHEAVGREAVTAPRQRDNCHREDEDRIGVIDPAEDVSRAVGTY